MRCGPASSARGAQGPSRRSTWTRCSNLTAAAQVDGVKFDGVDIFLYDPHINIDISDEDLKAVAAKIADKGFVVGTVVAPVWFDASAMGDASAARELLDRHSQGVPDRQEAARAGRSSLRRRPHRLGRATRRLGQGSGRQPEEDRRDVQAGGRDRSRSRRAPGRRGRDLLGRHALVADDGRPARTGRRARDSRFSGRHGRTRCFTRSAKTPPRIGSCPRTTTGKTAPSSTRRSRS